MAFDFKFKQREAEEMTAMRDISDDVIEPDFIPFACHFSPDTLLTKNGELMQTIKIVGFTFEQVESAGGDLRETIRQAVHDGLNSNDFAVWFHTIRRRTNLNPGGEYEEMFPSYVHESWNKRHDWEHKYVNQLFITIVCDGEDALIGKPKRFLRSMLVGAE